MPGDSLPPFVVRSIPLAEALVGDSLPLPLGMVATDMPHSGNGGAGSSQGVGGWEIKNASGRNRKLGDLVILRRERGNRGVYVSWVHGPLMVSYDPALARQPAIRYSAKLRSTDRYPDAVRRAFQIGNGLYQPDIYKFLPTLFVFLYNFFLFSNSPIALSPVLQIIYIGYFFREEKGGVQ